MKIFGDIVGHDSALLLAEKKFNFMSKSEPELFVKRIKDGQLVRVKILFTKSGKIFTIKSKEHRKLEKCFDELVERAKVLYFDKKNKKSKQQRNIKKTVSEE